MNEIYAHYCDENGKKHELTLNRGSAEWCNLDCPRIYASYNGETWLLNSGGTYLEHAPSDLLRVFCKFVWRSSLAFYDKYPEIYKGKNGFWINFVRNSKPFHPDLKSLVPLDSLKQYPIE